MNSTRTRPVFYDPEQRRWPRLRLEMLLLWPPLSLLLGALVVSILISPVAAGTRATGSEFSAPWCAQSAGADGGAGSGTPTDPAGTCPARGQTTVRNEGAGWNRSSPARNTAPVRRRQPGTRSRSGSFLVNCDDSSSLLLRENLGNLDIVIGEWLHVEDADGTLRDARVRVFTKTNGGKAAALNVGVTQTQAEIVVALDADTVFTRDTISKLVGPFASPRVGAVASNAKGGNRTNLMTRWQALEYITGQNLGRRAFGALNCVAVVPGAVRAWRRGADPAGGQLHARDPGGGRGPHHGRPADGLQHLQRGPGGRPGTSGPRWLV